jgi:hypothetical protein
MQLSVVDFKSFAKTRINLIVGNLSRGRPVVFKYNIKMKYNIYSVKHNYLMLY